MRKTTNVYFVVALMALDMLGALAAYVLAFELRFRGNLFPVQEMQPFAVYLGPMVLQAVLTPPIFAVNGLYISRRSLSWTDEMHRILAGVSVVSVVVMAASAVISHDFNYSRLMLAMVWALAMAIVFVTRLVHSTVLSLLRISGVAEDRVLIVGTGATARMILDRMRLSRGLGYRPVGFVVEETGPASIYGIPVLGTVDDVGNLVKEHTIDEVIIAISTLSHRQLLDIVSKCQGQSVNIKCFPDLFQLMASEVNITDLDGLPLIAVRDVALKGWNLVIKRWMDFIFSAVALVILSPIMLFLALLVKLTSPGGPVFYTQERVGLDGKPFEVIKFRSMKPDAEASTGAVFAVQGDPRTTRLGAWMRHYSIDELPQFVNVFLGDMSLVGPRPERPTFVEQFRQTVPRYFERHNEKAGLTGWAQINGLRGNTSVEDRTAYDLWYIENWTVWLDLKIILRTLFGGFTDKNAY